MSEKWQVGEIIEERYEIRQIKKGGMGIVFLCYDHQEHLPVALKTYQDKYLCDNRSIECFIHEASIWIHLDRHPNIVKAYQIDTIMFRPYIVLEYVVGDQFYGLDLHGWITRKGLDIKLTLDFAIQICEGMIFAQKAFQRQGYHFVHRDLKPRNILVTQERIAKITDFGLTISLDQKESLIGAGTPEYIAPEQFVGHTDLNVRTDVYAFGCILYEMIAGRSPFTAVPGLSPRERWNSLMEQHIHQLPPEPRQMNPHCSSALNQLILESLAKDPRERIADFVTLQERLQEIYHQWTGTTYQKLNYQPNQIAKRELIHKGVSLDSLGRYQEAIACYNQAFHMEDELNADYFLYIFRGSAHVHLGEVAQAMADYEQAMAIDPALPFAYGARANIYNNSGCLEQAIADYQRAISFDPKYQVGYYNRGLCYLRLQKYEEALQDFNQAIEFGFLEAYTNRGTSYLMLDRYAAAISDFNQAIRLNPRDFIAYTNRAFIYGMLGSMKEAFNDLETALQINPFNIEAYVIRASLWGDQGNFTKAIADYEQALQINPQDIQELVTMVNSARTGKDIEAMYPGIYINCGVCYFHLGQLSTAKEYLQHFLTIADPKNAYAIEKAYQYIANIEKMI